MRKKKKSGYIVHGSVERYLEKAIHGMKKANERENGEGSFNNLTRALRKKAQDEYPKADPAEIERIVTRQIRRGMRAYKPAPKPQSSPPPEEGLVYEREVARMNAKEQKKRMRGSRKKS